MTMHFGPLRKSLAILAVTCPALLGGAATSLAQDTLNIEGRWKEVRVKGAEGFKMSVVEFTPCGENMCGVRIDAKGKCGATFVETHIDEAVGYSGTIYPHYKGVISWSSRKLDFYVYRDENKLRMTGSEGRSPFSRVLPVNMLENYFERVGEATCKANVS
jgi:hypothetical protein